MGATMTGRFDVAADGLAVRRAIRNGLHRGPTAGLAPSVVPSRWSIRCRPPSGRTD